MKSFPRSLCLVLALVACRSEAERDRASSPPATASAVTPRPSPTLAAPRASDALGAMAMRWISYPADPKEPPRKTDPGFALIKLGSSRYQGRVAEACPAGTQVIRLEEGFKLDGTTLEVGLHGGGCPTYTGFTVAAKDPAGFTAASRDRLPKNTLPFYVCYDFEHDKCEAMMWNTWVFDLSALMVKSGTQDVVFAPPTPVDPAPASLCCCDVDNKTEVETWPTCEVRGGTCADEVDCYGHDGPIPD